MKNKNLLILGGLGVATYFIFIKPKVDAASDALDAYGGAATSAGNLFDALNPSNWGKDLASNLSAPIINFLGSTRYEAPAQVTTSLSTPTPILTSSVMGSGSYYGVTTFTPSGAAIVPTARSAQKAAVSFFNPKQSMTTQAKVASSLGVKTSWINPNVNKTIQTSTKNSSALFKYLR